MSVIAANLPFPAPASWKAKWLSIPHFGFFFAI